MRACSSLARAPPASQSRPVLAEALSEHPGAGTSRRAASAEADVLQEGSGAPPWYE